MTPQAEAELNQLCTSAFNSEYFEDKTLAIAQHQEAIKGLQQLLASSPDKQRKSIAKKQLKFHNARLLLLRPTGTSPEGVQMKLLPTAKTANDQLRAEGMQAISMNQFRLTQYRQSRATDPNAEIPSDIAHLMVNPVPFYTPTLPDLPPSVFDIHQSVEMNGYLGGHYVHVKAKDPTTQQTLYVLKLLKPARRQFSLGYLYRAAEFVGKPAASVQVSQVDPRMIGRAGGLYGRNFAIDNGLGVIQESMDRQLKPSWYPKRFSYGGRNFVWRERTGSRTRIGPSELYETAKVWPNPASKTGKLLDEVVPEPLSWGGVKLNLGNHSLAQLSIKGGVDQMFMEYILASQMAKIIVQLRGHD